nr:hypothetical protein [Tanacetum cinerariifolium]
MVRDSVQLEAAVNTISHEYLLEFTSEYGISEMLHPELPGPGDRIVDFPEGKDAGEWYLFCGGREGVGYASYPHPKTTGDVTVLGRYKSQILSRGREMDLFNLIRAPNPTKVKTESRPHAPHEVPLLTLTAAWVIEMDEPVAATDSSGVPSAVEKSPLDFAHEDEASDQGTTTPEVPPPEDVSATAALE